MAFAISEFKSNLTGGGARSSLFNVNLNFPSALSADVTDSSKYQFLISASSIPASTLATYDVFYHGKALKVAADRTFADWDTTIINDEDFAIRKNLESWIDLVSKPDLNTRNESVVMDKFEGTNADYKSDLSVTQFAKGGESLRTYKFIGAFPTTLSAITLSWETGTMETFTCTWAYDSWVVVP
jgi:hypothetical protein